MAEDKHTQKKIQELERQLKEAEVNAENGDLKYKRALADYQNLVRQTQRERETYVRFANTSLIEQLLPIIDNLEVATRHLDDEGIKMVVTQLHQVLDQVGVKKVEPAEGETFDETLHECVDRVVTKNEDQKNQIAEVKRPGYQWQDGMVIRHAEVSVFSLEESKNLESE